MDQEHGAVVRWSAWLGGIVSTQKSENQGEAEDDERASEHHNQRADDAALPTFEGHPTVGQLLKRSASHQLNEADAEIHERDAHRNEHEGIARHVACEADADKQSDHQKTAERTEDQLLGCTAANLLLCGGCVHVRDAA